jgi:hypothetical protein
MSKDVTAVVRLSVFGTKQKDAPIYKSLEDIADKEVTIISVAGLKGDFGNYVVMNIEWKGEVVQVRTGASFVVDALMDVEAQKAFPVLATFHKTGRLWRFE